MTTSESRSTSAAEAARNHHYAMAGLNPDGTPINQPQPDTTQTVVMPLEDGIAIPPQQPQDVQLQPSDNSEVEQLRAELAKLQRDHASVSGRLTPTQQELETARRALAESQQLQAQRDSELQKQIADLSAMLEEQRRKSFNPRELLTDDESAMIDDTQLQALSKIAHAVAAQEAEQIRANQASEIAKVNAAWQEQNRRDKISSTLANPVYGLDWVQGKAHDPVFNEWLMSDDGLVANQMLSNMLNASTDDVQRFARAASKELAKFPGHPTKATPPASAPTGGDLPNRLAAHATRSSNTSALNDRQLQEKIAEANQLSAMGGQANLAEAKKILDDLNKAYLNPRS